MEHIKYAKPKTHKTYKTRETQIYVVHPPWDTSTEKQPVLIIQQNEETQPTTDPL